MIRHDQVSVSGHAKAVERDAPCLQIVDLGAERTRIDDKDCDSRHGERLQAVVAPVRQRSHKNAEDHDPGPDRGRTETGHGAVEEYRQKAHTRRDPKDGDRLDDAGRDAKDKGNEKETGQGDDPDVQP